MYAASIRRSNLDTTRRPALSAISRLILSARILQALQVMSDGPSVFNVRHRWHSPLRCAGLRTMLPLQATLALARPFYCAQPNNTPAITW